MGSLEQCAGLAEIASELQESTAEPAAGQAVKKPSKAQLVGSSNRRVVSTLAANVKGHAEALAAAGQAATGKGRAMHAAIMTLAHACATTEAAHAGVSLPAQPQSTPCHASLCVAQML